MERRRTPHTLLGLLPLAIGIAGVGALTWFLLSQGVGVGTWLLAGLLVAHGWVHVMFVFPAPARTAGRPAWPFDMDRSWLVVGARLDVSVVRTIGVALMAVVVVGFFLGALSTVGLLVPVGWWSVLLLVSAASSFLMLVLFFSPQLLLGLAIDLALVWLVLASGWNPAAATVPPS